MSADLPKHFRRSLRTLIRIAAFAHLIIVVVFEFAHIWGSHDMPFIRQVILVVSATMALLTFSAMCTRLQSAGHPHILPMLPLAFGSALFILNYEAMREYHYSSGLNNTVEGDAVPGGEVFDATLELRTALVGVSHISIVLLSLQWSKPLVSSWCCCAKHHQPVPRYNGTLGHVRCALAVHSPQFQSLASLALVGGPACTSLFLVTSGNTGSSLPIFMLSALIFDSCSILFGIAELAVTHLSASNVQLIPHIVLALSRFVWMLQTRLTLIPPRRSGPEIHSVVFSICLLQFIWIQMSHRGLACVGIDASVLKPSDESKAPGIEARVTAATKRLTRRATTVSVPPHCVREGHTGNDSAWSDRGGVKILSLDGGGTKIVMPLLVLERLESICSDMDGGRSFLLDKYDFIGGISAGGLVTLMAAKHSNDPALGAPTTDITVRVIREAVLKVFIDGIATIRVWRLLCRGYVTNLTKTHRIFQKVFPATEPFQWTRGCPHAIVITNRIDDDKLLHEHVVANYPLPKQPTPPHLQQVLDDLLGYSYEISTGWSRFTAATATTTLPLVGPAVEHAYNGCDGLPGYFYDGGLRNNCPAAHCVIQATKLWPNKPIACVHSFGTGTGAYHSGGSGACSWLLAMAKPRNDEEVLFRKLRAVMPSLECARQQAANPMGRRLLRQETLRVKGGGASMVRIQFPEINNDYAANTTDPKKLAILENEAAVFIANHENMLANMIDDLKGVGPCVDRDASPIANATEGAHAPPQRWESGATIAAFAAASNAQHDLTPSRSIVRCLARLRDDDWEGASRFDEAELRKIAPLFFGKATRPNHRYAYLFEIADEGFTAGDPPTNQATNNADFTLPGTTYAQPKSDVTCTTPSEFATWLQGQSQLIRGAPADMHTALQHLLKLMENAKGVVQSLEETRPNTWFTMTKTDGKTLVYASKRFEARAGYAPEECIGRDFRFLQVQYSKRRVEHGGVSVDACKYAILRSTRMPDCCPVVLVRVCMAIQLYTSDVVTLGYTQRHRMGEK